MVQCRCLRPDPHFQRLRNYDVIIGKIWKRWPWGHHETAVLDGNRFFRVTDLYRVESWATLSNKAPPFHRLHVWPVFTIKWVKCRPDIKAWSGLKYVLYCHGVPFTRAKEKRKSLCTIYVNNKKLQSVLYGWCVKVFFLISYCMAVYLCEMNESCMVVAVSHIIAFPQSQKVDFSVIWRVDEQNERVGSAWAGQALICRIESRAAPTQKGWSHYCAHATHSPTRWLSRRVI